MRKFTTAVLLGLCLLCLQSAVWATIPGHIMLDYISDAYPLNDGALVGFAYKTVSASTADTGSNIFYIEEPDRSSGIRVYWMGSLPQPARNHCVVVGGTLWTMNGERQICLDYLLDLGSNPAITPLGMDNPAIGGMSFNALTPGITDALGPYNKGLLIRAWGYVQASDDTGRYFYIDDGSGLSDGSGSTGVRVSARSGITLPSVGDYVIVTGVASTYLPGDVNCRMIIARDPADIVTVAAPTLLESKDAITPGMNTMSVPGVPWNNGSGSTTPDSVFATTYNYACDGKKLDPSTQLWRGITEGYNTVYSDEGYSFRCDNSNVLHPSTGNTVSYNAVLGILEQTDRYIPLYAGSNGGNWVGCPFRTGSQINASKVTNGARTYSAYQASTMNWVERYAERWDGIAQGSVAVDFTSSEMHRPWTAIRVTSKRTCAMIIQAPSGSVQMLDRPDHVLAPCETVPIQAKVTNTSGGAVNGVTVWFKTTHGVFTQSGTASASAVTNSLGIATVNYRGNRCGIAQIGATANVGGRVNASQFIHVTVDGWNLQVDLSKFAAHADEFIGVVAKLRDCALSGNISGKQITLTTSAGLFANSTNTLVANTDANGEVITTLKISGCPATATVAATLTHAGCAADLRDYKTVSIECDTGTYDNWTTFQHDPQHTSLSTTWDAAGPAMLLKWSTPLPTSNVSRSSGSAPANHPSLTNTWIFGHPYIDSSPVVYGSKVVVGTWTGTYDSSLGTVRAYDAASTNENKLLWETSVSMGGVASTPTIYGGMVFVGSADGKLYCLNLTTGAVIWSRQTTNRSLPQGNSKILSSPVVYNGVVYITNEASKIYAYTANSSGTLLVGYPVSLPIDQHGITERASQNVCGASSPALGYVSGYHYLLVGSDDGYLYRMRLSDRQVCGIYMDACVESSPSISGNTVQVGSTIYRGNSCKRLSIEPFKILSNWWLGEECRATPSISANGHLYAGVDTGNTIFKMDRTSVNQGTILAQFNAGTYFVGSASHTKSTVTNNDWVYTGNDDGWLYGLRESDMTQVWKYKLASGATGGCSGSGGQISTTPAIGYNVDAEHNRWVFVTSRTDGGKLFAFAAQPGCNLVLSYPGDAGPCDNQVTVTASCVQNGWPAQNQPVTFTTTNGTFAESGAGVAVVLTDSDGIARATLNRPSAGNEADVTASSACDSDALHIVFGTYTLNLTASPSQVQPGRPADLTVTLTDPDASPAAGETVNLTTTAGVFADGSTYLDAVTDTNGEVHTTLTFSGCPEEATVTATYSLTCTSYSDSTTVKSVADTWTSFQGDNRNSGVTVSYLGASMVKKWSMPIAGNYDTEIWSSPIALGNSVWVATNSANGTVYRFLSDGTVMATRNLGSPVIGTPCLDPSTGTLYVGTQEGVLHSMNATNLNPNWSFSCYNSTEEIWSSPKLSNGAVYFVSTDATNNVSYLYIVDASGGYEWSTPAQMGDEVVYSTPSIDETNPYGGRVYAAGSNGHVAAFGIYGGTYWEVQGDEHCYYSSPVVSTDRILIGNCNKEFGVYPWMDTGSTATLSKFEGIGTDDRVFATPAVYDGKIAFGTNIVVGSAFWFADQATWGLDWRTPLLDSINTSALICPSTGLVFSASIAGRLYGFALGDGLVDWNFDIRADLGSQDASVKSSFAAADDKMYIVAGTANARYLYCFGAP